MTHPTDALRLVPVEPTEAMLDAAIEGFPQSHPSVFPIIYRYMIDAAPASPLPGGGDWIDGTPEVPVGSPAWCAWATHEIMNLRAKPPAAPTGEPK